VEQNWHVTGECPEISVDVMPRDPIHPITAKLTVPTGVLIFVDTVSFRPQKTLRK
jgi:hypothetical protein